MEWALVSMLGLFLGALYWGWSRGRALAAAEAERDRALDQAWRAWAARDALQAAFRAAVEAEVAARRVSGNNVLELLRPPAAAGGGAAPAPGAGTSPADTAPRGRDAAPPGADGGAGARRIS